LPLLRNRSGNDNAAYGENALARNITGSNNVAVGASAGFHLTIGNNNIDIGNKGVADESNTIRVGTEGTQQATFIAGIYGTTTAGTDALPVVIDSDGQLGTASAAATESAETREIAELCAKVQELEKRIETLEARIQRPREGNH